MTRDCKTCIHSEIGHGEGNGCTAWTCEYINKGEALEVYKQYKEVLKLMDTNALKTVTRKWVVYDREYLKRNADKEAELIKKVYGEDEDEYEL